LNVPKIIIGWSGKIEIYMLNHYTREWILLNCILNKMLLAQRMKEDCLARCNPKGDVQHFQKMCDWTK